jgi:hypothetical protein
MFMMLRNYSRTCTSLIKISSFKILSMVIDILIMITLGEDMEDDEEFVFSN